VRVSTLSATPPGTASVTSAEYLSLVNRVSTNSAAGGAGSVTSTEASAISAQAASALSQAISVLSPSTRVLATSVVISAATMTTVAGLSVSVDAGGVYQFQAQLIVVRGAAAQPYGYGLSFPAMKHIRGKIWAAASVVQAGLPTLSVIGPTQPFEGDSASTSVLISTISMAVLSTTVAYGGLMKVSTTGVIHLLAKASSGAAAITIHDGSYIQVFKIA
jgi:hypothetical protein